MSIKPLASMAPITAAVRAQFQRDSTNADHIIAAAERKGNTCTRWEAEDEVLAARDHFELGCWLHHYAGRVGQPDAFQDRVDCVRHCWEAGVTNVEYRFFTVFGFGSRDFDTCFEMGDGDEVAEALKELARADPAGPIAAGARAFKWDIDEPAAGMRP